MPGGGAGRRPGLRSFGWLAAIYLLVAGPLVGLGVPPVAACSAGVLGTAVLAAALGFMWLGLAAFGAVTDSTTMAEERLRVLIRQEIAKQ